MARHYEQVNETLAIWEKTIKDNPTKLHEVTQKFMNELEGKITQHDQEIEQLCSTNYKSFIDCIQELLQVRPNAEQLKIETVETNAELMKSTDAIQKKVEELIRARRILVNSTTSIELLKRCLIVLEQYSKFNNQLKEMKYFPALKTLESLEKDYLPTVLNYRFAQSMCKEIPKFRMIIKDATTQDLNDFLEGLLVKSHSIGQRALAKFSDASNALDSIDFGPVYRGLHIFTNLGFKDQFDEYYREQRQKQSRLAFTPPTMQTITAYQDYVSSIIGFFVIENHIMCTTKDLIKSSYLNELWQSAIQSMTLSIGQNAKGCRDASLMLDIKKLVIEFTFTIRNYGHDTDILGEILIAIREQYNVTLMDQWERRFDLIFREDSYHPLEVQDNEEYLQAVKSMSYETKLRSFPQKLPFSSFVPKICHEIRLFIEESLKFSQDLNSPQMDVENIIRNSTNKLLTEKLGSCLTRLIADSSLKLLQLIQITINTNYLENEIQYFDEHITYQVCKSLSGLDEPSKVSDSVKTKLQGISMFKDMRAEAESQIYKKLNDQIDEFLSLSNYDWTVAEPNGQASSYITDLIAWLKSTFQAFTNLPQPLAQGACMSACKHIAQSLRDLLLSEDVKGLSLGGLQQLELDLIQCEVFANSDPVKGFNEGDLQMAFAELRQLLDLFLYEDYSQYISDMGKQQNKYLRVTTATALVVVDKLREYDRKKSVFALKKNDKQKLRDTFAKNLRQAQQQQQV